MAYRNQTRPLFEVAFNLRKIEAPVWRATDNLNLSFNL